MSPAPSLGALLGLNDARGEAWQGQQQLWGGAEAEGGWQPCPGPWSLPAEPLWSVSRPRQWEARCSLTVRALHFGRALLDDSSSNKVRSSVSRLGGLGRALIWMFGFLSPPVPGPLERCSVSPVSAALREQLPFVLPCIHPAGPAGGASWGGPGAAGAALTSLPRHPPRGHQDRTGALSACPE